MGVLDVAERLRTLASDPEHRRGIVAEQGMLPTLTVFLENGDAAVRRATLDTLELLAREPRNCAPMLAEPGLAAALAALSDSGEDAEAAALAARVAAAIGGAGGAAPRTPSAVERVNVQPLLGVHAPASEHIRTFTFFVKVRSLFQILAFFFFFFSHFNGSFRLARRDCMARSSATRSKPSSSM